MCLGNPGPAEDQALENPSHRRWFRFPAKIKKSQRWYLKEALVIKGEKRTRFNQNLIFQQEAVSAETLPAGLVSRDNDVCLWCIYIYLFSQTNGVREMGAGLTRQPMVQQGRDVRSDCGH